jgi:phosphoglycerate dehydrogenase-like enzyme
MDFSDALMNDLRAVSPRLHIERHFPKVPDKAWATVEILYTGSILPDPGQAPNLRWVQLNSAGMDHFANHPLLQDEKITFTTASGIHATQMAEFSLAMILAFNYKLPTMYRLQGRAEWPPKTDNPTDMFAPRDLRGQTLGIAGYGSVGRELARLADSFGMRVLVTKRDLMHLNDDEGYTLPGTGDADASIPDRLYPPEALASMARESDYLVVTLPLTEGTRHTVNAAVLNAMKPTAVLVNIGRGPVVDEKALIEALQAKKIAGAALDVFEQEPLPASSPLWKMENVIVSPHVAGANAEYKEKAATLFAENLQRYIEGESLLNRINRTYGY